MIEAPRAHHAPRRQARRELAQLHGALQPSRSARDHLWWLAHSQGVADQRAGTVVGQAGLGEAARRKSGEAAK
jgi:ABC-2 type transport system ATP-binding protein